MQLQKPHFNKNTHKGEGTHTDKAVEKEYKFYFMIETECEPQANNLFTLYVGLGAGIWTFKADIL